MKSVIAVSLFAAALSLSSVASAQDAESPDGPSAATSPPPASRFGAAHTAVISADTFLSIEHTSESTVTTTDGRSSITEGGGSSTAFQIAPSIDLFVIDDFSIGGQVALQYASTSAGSAAPANSPSASTLGFGLGPRVGYNFTMSDEWSFWPRAGVTFATATVSMGDTAPTKTTESMVSIDLYAPILLHPAPHFFVGFGPNLDAQVSHGETVEGTRVDRPKQLKIGAALTLGGWL